MMEYKTKILVVLVLSLISALYLGQSGESLLWLNPWRNLLIGVLLGLGFVSAILYVTPKEMWSTIWREGPMDVFLQTQELGVRTRRRSCFGWSLVGLLVAVCFFGFWIIFAAAVNYFRLRSVLPAPLYWLLVLSLVVASVYFLLKFIGRDMERSNRIGREEAQRIRAEGKGSFRKKYAFPMFLMGVFAFFFDEMGVGILFILFGFFLYYSGSRLQEKERKNKKQ
jgi:lipid-A-disaccharide synthase-like uncharacterized protein